jgi:hypothetical protein
MGRLRIPAKLAIPIALLPFVVACTKAPPPAPPHTRAADEASPHDKETQSSKVPAVKNLQAFVRITAKSTNIRLRPKPDAQVVAEAREGDIFKFSEVRGEWYGIYMFSGEARYIHSSVAKRTGTAPPMSSSAKVRRSACFEIGEAQDRARREAEVRYPSDFEKQALYERSLYDKYELPIFQKYGIPPAQNAKLVVECAQKRWIPAVE